MFKTLDDQIDPSNSSVVMSNVSWYSGGGVGAALGKGLPSPLISLSFFHKLFIILVHTKHNYTAIVGDLTSKFYHYHRRQFLWGIGSIKFHQLRNAVSSINLANSLAFQLYLHRLAGAMICHF